MRSLSFFAGLVCLPALVLGQLSGTVGPVTSLASKRAIKICNVLDYGGKADNATDLGPPLGQAFAACKTGGVVYIPAGNYLLTTFQSLSSGSKWALQLDGTIYRNAASDGGNMILIDHGSDFEMFSSNGQGAIQGHGYLDHKAGKITGARTLRLQKVDRFSAHDFKLVDAPSFHFSMDTCSNGEVYNMLVRGGNQGGLDGIDVWGTNMHIHDVMITNKDECVTVKSPSQYILVENVYCNWSGGCAIGSLGADTAISDIQYKNVYSKSCNQMMLIKSNGGSGYVDGVSFTNFIGHANAYSLDIDQYWSGQSTAAGNGVQLSNITFNNWKGTAANGAQRGPIRVVCADNTPCYSININNFAMWTDTGSTELYTCQSSYGTGGCLRSGSSHTKYAVTTQTVKTAPAGYSTATMPYDLATPTWGTTASIPTPSWPASFYPGTPPISKLAAS